MRGALVAGVDISTHAVTAALLPLDPDQHVAAEFRHVRVRQSKNPCERLRSVRDATHHALRDPDDGEVLEVYVERPPFFLAQKGRTELVEVYGAVVASTPRRVQRVGGLEPQTWRSMVGLQLHPADVLPRGKSRAGGWKRAAIRRVLDQALVPADYPLSDHEAEAVLVAIAGRGLHWQAHNPKEA